MYAQLGASPNCCVRKGCGTIREAYNWVRLQLGAAQLGAAQLSMAQPERSKTEGGSEGRAWPGPLCWSAHHIFAEEGGFGYVIVDVSCQDV